MGRHSDNKLYNKSSKKPISGRTSMDRSSRMVQEVLPKRSANAWLPKRAEKNVEKDQEEIKIQSTKKVIRGLLNKITPSTYDALVEEFCNYKIYKDDKLLPVIIDLIFDKAVEEPRFCPLYSDLCYRQVVEEREDATEIAKKFFQGIIFKCQSTFLGVETSDAMVKEEEKLLEDETDESKKPEIQEKIQTLKSKEKRRLLGIIKFIAQLYRHNLLINHIIQWCVVELVTTDEIYIEYAVQMVRTVGHAYEMKKQANNSDDQHIQQIMQHLDTLKPHLSNRVRFMIMDLEDLEKNNWIDKKEQVPKTMEQVRNELEQEQINNQAERDAYERKISTNNYRRDQAQRNYTTRTSYGGRGSTDNRMEKRSAAVLASSLTSSGQTLRKETNSKLSRKNWSSGKPLDNKASASSSPPTSNNLIQQEGHKTSTAGGNTGNASYNNNQQQ